MKNGGQQRIPTFLKGISMGIAEVIPGVSGGTLAFITGIYYNLLSSIKAFDIKLMQLVFTGRLAEAWRKVNGGFLIFLLPGMVSGVLIGVFGITHVLDNYPPVIWAFFFGLILASVVYVGRQIGSWGSRTFFVFILGGIIAYGITILSPAESQAGGLYVFFSGMIAISALLLPGISGSFILLLLGLYTIIIPSLKRLISEADTTVIPLLIIFALGCIAGLVIFSRVLTYVYRKFRSETMAVLTGFMLGSLNKIWPWRNPVRWLDEDGVIKSGDFPLINGEHLKIITEVNVLPSQYFQDSFITLAILAFVFGLVLVYAIARISGGTMDESVM